MDETQALFEQIMSATAVRPRTPAPIISSPPLSFFFVGCEQELPLAVDKLLVSRVYHEMGTLRDQMGDMDQAIAAMKQAAAISREAGYAPGLAHSLVGLSYLYTRLQQTKKAHSALVEALQWFRIIEDQACIHIVDHRLRQLEDNPALNETPRQKWAGLKLM